MPNTIKVDDFDQVKEKLIELLSSDYCPLFLVFGDSMYSIVDYLIANGVTVQEWIPVTERLPEENGYYLCNVCFSSIAECKSYRRMILYFEDNMWIDMPNCFRTRKPTHWMPLPEPPGGE